MIAATPVSVLGREYVIRFTVGALIRAEKEMQKPITTIGRDTTLGDAATLLRYGLHHPDGRQISREEYDAIMNEMGPAEFGELLQLATREINPGKTPEKN